MRALSVLGSGFSGRAAAGRVLAARLVHYAHARDVVVLGLPRGGVPVAYEVAVALDAPLDVFLVRKLGVPGQAELAMGAIADGGIRVMNQSVADSLKLGEADVETVAAREEAELARRREAYGGGRAPVDVGGKVVIVVDDGMATGATMRAAVAALRTRGPRRIVVAVPVGARSTCIELGAEADEVVCARSPLTFQAVGQWYEDFSPTTDEEIRSLLAAGPGSGPARPS